MQGTLSFPPKQRRTQFLWKAPSLGPLPKPKRFLGHINSSQYFKDVTGSEPGDGWLLENMAGFTSSAKHRVTFPYPSAIFFWKPCWKI